MTINIPARINGAKGATLMVFLVASRTIKMYKIKVKHAATRHINDPLIPKNKQTTIKSFMSPIPNDEDSGLPFFLRHLLFNMIAKAIMQQINAEAKTCFATSIKISNTDTSIINRLLKIHLTTTLKTQMQNKVKGIQFGILRVFASLTAAIEQNTINKI